MMNERKIEFCKKVEGQAVNVLQKETQKLVIIYYRGGSQQASLKTPIHLIPKVVIKVPAPLRYTSDKAVLWNYTNQVISREPQAIRVSLEEKQDPLVNDIAGTGGLTCSGRCYVPSTSGVKEGENVLKRVALRPMF